MSTMTCRGIQKIKIQIKRNPNRIQIQKTEPNFLFEFRIGSHPDIRSL